MNDPILAYLDPITGGALMQVVLGGLAAVGLGYHYLRRRANSLISRFRSQESSDEATGNADPSPPE